MKQLEVRFTHGPTKAQKVGILAEDRRRIYFEYDSEFLATGWSLSPFHLPFEPGLFEHTDYQFGPLPGLFDDSLPDGWGLLLMDRYFRSLRLDPAEVSPLDRLSWLGTRTMGALTYHPPTDAEDLDCSVFDLHDLARQSQNILSGAAEEVLPQLLRAGGSPGGARPKVLVGFNPATGNIVSGEDELADGFEHWIVKFSPDADSADAGPIEYAYSLMAAGAGVDMPETRLFETREGDRFFGVKRFDRRGNRRFFVHTFGNLIQANFRVPSADYADLLKATSLLTRDHQEVVRTFRRMVFNVFAHNRDDHVKNSAFLLDATTGDWRLTPAYDLLFTTGPGGEHSMTVAGEGRNPDRSLMLQLARQTDISEREAERIIEQVRSAVSSWPDHASKGGVSAAGTKRIGKSIDATLC